MIAGTVYSVSHGNLISRGYVYDHGNVSYLDYGTEANDINNSGVVVGSANHKAAMFANGTTTMLVKNASYSSATAINNAGVVVGTYPVSFSPWQDSVQEGFVSNNGVFTTIADHKPFPLTIIPSNISSNGNVAGNEQDPNYLNVTSAWAIINGKFTKLGGLHDFSDGRIHSSVNDINRSGWAVGAAELSNGMSHATLYENGSVFDLNSLVDPSLNVTLTAAGGINDKGQIVATACTGVWNGCSVVLLNPLAAPPVPEPETYAMLLGGLGVVGVAVRRRRRYAKG